MAACDYYQELISQRLDASLSAHETAALDAHLLQCAACRALCEDLNHIRAALSALGESGPPADFSDSVLEKIRPDKTIGAKSGPRRRWLGLAAIAACCIVATGLTQWYSLIHGGAGTNSVAPAAAAPFSAYAPQDAETAADPPAEGLARNSEVSAATEDARAPTQSDTYLTGSLNPSANFQPWHTEPSGEILAVHQDLKTRLDEVALQLLFFTAAQQNLLPDSTDWQQGEGYQYLKTEEQTFHNLVQTADWANLLTEAGGGCYLVVME